MNNNTKNTFFENILYGAGMYITGYVKGLIIAALIIFLLILIFS